MAAYASRLLRHPAREQGDPPRCSDTTADWAAQQIVECCAWDRAPPRFLIHGRDSRCGANFDRRVRGLGIWQVRTPFKSPRANAVAERWVRSARSECLDHLIIFSEANLRRVLSAYVTYYNRGRPHRSSGQAVPCVEARPLPRQACRKIAPSLCLAGYTTFTAPVHDKFLRPTAESSTSEPKGQELVYAARISLDCTQMQVEDNLSPGMAVTVEVKTGSRAA
jgi:hypothetical protein